MSFKAEIVADSKNEICDSRLTSYSITFPRIILAELNTHRILSKNSASSRAIPYKKMLKSVIENPFIPIAFQKDHSGMQGIEYLDMDKEYEFDEISKVLIKTLSENFKNENGEWDKDSKTTLRVLEERVMPLLFVSRPITIKEWWLRIRDLVVAGSLILNAFGVTKQICNRLLEPFMWHTVMITGTEWENFFALRVHPAAEIHMQRIASMMLEAYNLSIPKVLRPGEWHIPYHDKIVDMIKKDGTILFPYPEDLFEHEIESLHDDEWATKYKIKASNMIAARTSYTVVGEDQKPWTFDKYVDKGTDLETAKPLHASPLEHCGLPMDREHVMEFGVWSGNFRGFIQYRKMLEGENAKDSRVIKK